MSWEHILNPDGTHNRSLHILYGNAEEAWIRDAMERLGPDVWTLEPQAAPPTDNDRRLAILERNKRMIDAEIAKLTNEQPN